MKLLFLGAHPTSEFIRINGSKIDSLYRSDEAIIKGIRCISKLDVITSPDIASFPRNNFYYHSFYDKTDRQYVVSCLNIPIIKQLWTLLALLYNSIKYILKSKDKVTIIIPYIVFKHVMVTRILKILFRKRVSILAIVPDFFFQKSIIRKALNDISMFMAKRIDYFVLYTECMAEYLNIKNEKQYVVIEGFLDIIDREPEFPKNKFIIAYTGSLNEKYGVIRLLDSMKFLEFEDVELHLYGAGDSVETIKERALLDRRIKYGGRVSKEKATDVIYNSSVLVNPRNSGDGEYVKYSFPSKDIDYLSTGVPSILCKLPGMPPSYYGYFIDAGEGTPKELASAITKIYKTTEKDRKEIGVKAKNFITNRMNLIRQAESILSLIS